jgi:lipopolysaccharide export system protein LptA
MLPILAAGFALACAVPLAAQTVSNTFGGLSQSSDEPIDIESDLLVVHDKDKYAVFTGSVKAVQGTTTLRAKELLVHYTGGDRLSPGKKDEAKPAEAKVAEAQGAAGAAAPDKAADGDKAKQGDTQITKIEAKGDVIIESEDDQTTTSDWALYDLPSQLVTVGGNVVLTQGKNVLKGDRLVIDLKTGESRFDNTGNTAAGGRIRALFMPKQNGEDGKSGDAKDKDAKDGKDAKSGDAKPDEAKSGDAKPKHEAASGAKPDRDSGADDKASKDDDWTSKRDPFIDELR